MKYAAIADWADEEEYSITFMCDQLGVCRQGYYRWRATGACQRERTDAELTEIIHKIHTELSGDPGLLAVTSGFGPGVAGWPVGRGLLDCHRQW